MRKQFLESEFGKHLVSTITEWDEALKKNCRTSADKKTLSTLAWCQAQWEVYRMAIKHFYGVEYHFTRTDEYYGLCTEDESDWLMKVDREQVNSPRYEATREDVVAAMKAVRAEEGITYHASAQELGQALRNLRCQHS